MKVTRTGEARYKALKNRTVRIYVSTGPDNIQVFNGNDPESEDE